jgi:hypothetical protein
MGGGSFPLWLFPAPLNQVVPLPSRFSASVSPSKEHRRGYCRLQNAPRTEGEWEEWLRFFHEGVAVTAEGAASTAGRLRELFEGDQVGIQKVGRRSGSALRRMQSWGSQTRQFSRWVTQLGRRSRAESDSARRHQLTLHMSSIPLARQRAFAVPFPEQRATEMSKEVNISREWF